MGLPRPHGFAGLKSWFVRAFNPRFSRKDPSAQVPVSSHEHISVRPFTSGSKSTPRIPTKPIRPLSLNSSQIRQYHQFQFPRSKQSPNFPGIRYQQTAFLLRPQLGAFPRSPWGTQLGGTAKFHTSPASSAIALSQIAHSVSTALRTGRHPVSKPNDTKGQIAAQVAARAACQNTDGPAGYIRFTLSPPQWTPTDTDLSDPDIIKAIDTHISELERIKKALGKLKRYGDFPVRAVVPSNPEATIDVLFRGATAEDVARWNKNEFKLGSGRVGADQVFCAGRFEDDIKWSEVLDAERKVERDMAMKNGDAALLNFWEELNLMEGRIR